MKQSGYIIVYKGFTMGENNKKSNYLVDFWNGERFPSQQGKFRAICIGLSVVHLILMIYFFVIGHEIVGAYNIFSSIYYLVSGIAIGKNDNFFKIFLETYIEITVYAVFATILCGWNMGFMLYIIALCPVSFFITYTIPGRQRNLTTPFIFSFLSLVIFIWTKVYIDASGTIDYGISDKQIRVCYNFNCIVTFMVIMILSALFAMEIRAKEKELEARNAELTDISSVDPLTKLLNRRTMDVCLEKAVNKVKSTGELFTVIIGDIDNFKKVNDVYGHNIGDDVLKMVAKTIREALPNDGILCRWGGEEFLILLSMKEDEAIPIIENVRKEVSEGRVLVEKKEGDIELGVTMTFGMSEYIHGFTIEKVISIADDNLYAGKEHGKNRVVHSKTVI